MSWKIEFRREVEDDILEAANWYESRRAGLGHEFVNEVVRVWDSLVENPFANSRRHPRKNIRWRYPKRFPYRVIYEVDEVARLVIVAAVLHAARDEWRWKQRFP
jgi:plasmid stabilization system protein ParE